MRRADPGFTFGCLWAGGFSPVMAAFLSSTNSQGRLTALPSGVLRHGGTTQACDPSTGCDEVFLRVFHLTSLRLVFLRQGIAGASKAS